MRLRVCWQGSSRFDKGLGLFAWCGWWGVGCGGVCDDLDAVWHMNGSWTHGWK